MGLTFFVGLKNNFFSGQVFFTQATLTNTSNQRYNIIRVFLDVHSTDDIRWYLNGSSTTACDRKVITLKTFKKCEKIEHNSHVLK